MGERTLKLDPITIDAPAEVAWNILTDLENYPDWNPFTVRADSNLVIGEPVVLHIPRGGKITKQTMVLEILEPPRVIAWRMPKLLHRSILSAYRVQTITSLNENQCTYDTSDTFSGLAAGAIAKATGDWVEDNFAKLGAALKERAEQRQKI